MLSEFGASANDLLPAVAFMDMFFKVPQDQPPFERVISSSRDRFRSSPGPEQDFLERREYQAPHPREPEALLLSF